MKPLHKLKVKDRIIHNDEFESSTRIDNQYFQVRWPNIEHKAVIKFILNNNVIFIVSHKSDRQLLLNSLNDTFKVPEEVIELMSEQHPYYTPYFRSDRFIREFWKIAHDLSFSTILDNNSVTRYFVTDDLRELCELPLNIHQSKFPSIPIVFVADPNTRFSYTKGVNPSKVINFEFDFDEEVQLSSHDFRVIESLASEYYTNFIDLFSRLPLSVKGVLWILFNQGNYPDYFQNYPFFLQLVLYENGRRSIRMNNESFSTIAEIHEKSFLTKIKNILNKHIIES